MLELTTAQDEQITQDSKTQNSNTVIQLACPSAQLPTQRPNQPAAKTNTRNTVDIYIRLHTQATNTPLSIAFEMLGQRTTKQLFDLAQKNFDVFTLNTATCMPVYYQHTLIGTASIKVPGEPFEDYGSSILTDKIARSLAIIQVAAILTGDPDPDGNILSNASTQTLTRIDFERAYLLDRSESNIPNASYPKGIKADAHFSFAPWIYIAQHQEPTSNLMHMLCLPWQTPQRIYSLLTHYFRTMKTCLSGAPCRTLLRQSIESIRIHPLLNIDDTALSHAKTILQKRIRYIKISDLDATLADPRTAERIFKKRVSPCPRDVQAFAAHTLRYLAVVQALRALKPRRLQGPSTLKNISDIGDVETYFQELAKLIEHLSILNNISDIGDIETYFQELTKFLEHPSTLKNISDIVDIKTYFQELTKLLEHPSTLKKISDIGDIETYFQELTKFLEHVGWSTITDLSPRRATDMLTSPALLPKSTPPASPLTSPWRSKQRSSTKHHEALENFRLDGEAGATLP